MRNSLRTWNPIPVLAILVMVAIGFVMIRAEPSVDATVTSSDRVTSETAPTSTSTSTTIPQANIDTFLIAWSDSEKAVAYEAFQAEQAKIDAEAAAAVAEAERQAQEQAQAEYEAAVAEGDRYVYTEGPNAGGTCVIPSYICQRESGGNYGAVNSSSGAGGMYQFMPSTWNAIAAAIAPEWIGVPPQNAPPAVQDQFAAYLWNGGAGCGHWSAC